MASDGEIISLDWFPRNYKKMWSKTPVVMYVPGVFGRSCDVYSFKFCEMLTNRLGWRSFVFNRRLFAGNFKGTRFISYTHYSDWLEILDYVAREFPEANIYLVGVSMGALNIQKFLALYNNEKRVVAAVTISSPFDAQSAADLVLNNYFLNKVLHGHQVRVFREHLHNEKFTEFMRKKGIDPIRVIESKTNQEFDAICSSVDLGVNSPRDYYNLLSVHTHIQEIKHPILSLNSEDDPLIPPSNVPLEEIVKNPNIIQLMVAGGGHIEYLSGLKGEFWAYDLAIDYLDVMEKRSQQILNL